MSSTGTPAGSCEETNPSKTIVVALPSSLGPPTASSTLPTDIAHDQRSTAAVDAAGPSSLRTVPEKSLDFCAWTEASPAHRAARPPGPPGAGPPGARDAPPWPPGAHAASSAESWESTISA